MTKEPIAITGYIIGEHAEPSVGKIGFTHYHEGHLYFESQRELDEFVRRVKYAYTVVADTSEIFFRTFEEENMERIRIEGSNAVLLNGPSIASPGHIVPASLVKHDDSATGNTVYNPMNLPTDSNWSVLIPAGDLSLRLFVIALDGLHKPFTIGEWACWYLPLDMYNELKNNKGDTNLIINFFDQSDKLCPEDIIPKSVWKNKD